MELEFSGQIFEKSSHFMKIRPVGAELLHTDGRTNIAAAFRNFANAPKSAMYNPNIKT